ncbi:MAG: IS200/IS605 family element transposase accessory protein TnpB [Okeania sp. SIO2C9]|uniref:RNA-guided endonuclease InsQ/TnpB family protein n=1 Tax=Okeania sp. SIO2C9 TaxID=2607791 RepID=UPI0013C0F2F3|nr:RNA-guided endonuclease TnpB family protein [Okeania sp. SIO2C9]NEQ74556.1 IS200/IS605 family element transposase accessory protein TnpB [Okeania sp. SIO2C9]
MKARYKYRIYPNHIQTTKLNQLFGCCRYVWNQSLAHCNKLYAKGDKKPSYTDLTKQFITSAKKELIWLKDVASTPLQQSLKDLDQAYKNFFDSCKGKRKSIKAKPPKFKSRKSRQAARFVGANYKVCQDKIYLPKVGKIKIVWSRPLASQPTSVTIIKDSANRYFASFVVETNSEFMPKTNNSIGIDLGISTFATLSNGDKINAPKPLQKKFKKLAKFQRKFARTEVGSKRREKARVRVAKLSYGMLRKHAKIQEIRTDFLHKLSTNLVSKYDTIVLEDLNVSGMVSYGMLRKRNHKLAKAINDLGWRQFRTLTESKCDKYGKEFRVINRWEPTTRKCSHCGFKGGKKELNVSCGMLRKREWTCLNCGTFHDRDINAAVNILNTPIIETVTQRITKVETIKAEVLETPVQLSIFEVVAEGQRSIIYRTRRRRKAGSKSADSNDVSTRPEFKQLRLF